MSTAQIAGQPRYAQVAQALIEDIQAGRYPVGTLLPTEQELCRQFDISRHTVREATGRLQSLGLVTRRPGIGTRVRSDRVSQRYVQVGDSVSDLYQYERDVTFSLKQVADVEAEGGIADLLGGASGQIWTRLQGLRSKRDAPSPIALTDIYVARSFRGVCDVVDDSGLPVWSLIEQRYGVSPAEVRQQIGAALLDEGAAALLRATPGDPALRVTRHYLNGSGATYLVAINLYPADRFTYSNTLRIESRAPGSRAG
ncbi:GntR family transcriptional regulator [Chachezhania antarctica]|uniref:GntR family transcriptional regulator n=1 Tax=Chachezhania antarctica TaxID=2340860 RepID=UPI000EB2F0B7|nr:GntR family transcriptional regulator [Chachezhania antarctica]|tara:strand:+ start:6817 stop:7581 length:765 start_codon:yes stop_codon:yes gene_type:complete